MDIKYIDNDYRFLLRSACIIFNNDKTKVLLFDVNNKGIYLIPGGKIRELESSEQAVKRELKEEIGIDDIDITFAGISEEMVNAKGYDNHQINLIYKGIYKEPIKELEFNGLEGDWIKFKWIDIKDINKYNIFPSLIKQIVKNDNIIYHEIEKIGV